MSFNACDMLPNESVALTVQHLDDLAGSKILSEKVRGICDNASAYLKKLVLDGDTSAALKPIPSKYGDYFGNCPKCNKAISALQQPHFCGYCGCKVAWEGWE